MWHAGRLVCWLVGIGLVVGACGPGGVSSGGAPPGGASTGDANGPASGQAAATPKALRVAITREPAGFIVSLSPSASSSGGGQQLQNLPANKLQDTDAQGQRFAELAEVLPSTADGTWTINADGTMATTWQLRPNLTWH